MTRKRAAYLRGLNFKGVTDKAKLREIAKGVSIDELAGLRYAGYLTLGQYAAIISLDKPWMDIVEEHL